MTAILLKFWPYIASSVLGGILVFTVMHMLQAAEIRRLNDRQAAALQTLSAQLVKECQNDKKITSDASQSYQAQLASTRADLDRLKRVRPSACVPVSVPASKPARGRNAGAGTGKLSGSNGGGSGVDRDFLLDIAAEADDQRGQLIACQKFIRDTWAAKK